MGTLTRGPRESADGKTTPIRWDRLREVHRSQVARILDLTDAFRPEEIEVALEVFDDYLDDPDLGYEALAAFDGQDDTLAGFAFYGATPCTVGTWDLYWIAVHPRYQGSGIGRELLEGVESRLRKAKARLCVVETSSREDYTATRRFYASCGYREVARVPEFYDEDEDMVIFTKPLAPPKDENP
ncbi:MAG: GNAT family N-acetyltransferase [Rhodothermales bacterium]|nr:GNAT family N-acetyltransferase [Rhodothermales bacterium]